jgi:hypothetical protein
MMRFVIGLAIGIVLATTAMMMAAPQVGTVATVAPVIIGADTVGFTLEIPTTRFDAAKAALLKLHPVPLDENGDPEFADNAWIKEWLRRLVRDEIARGKTRIAQEAAVVPPDDDDVL